MHQPLDETCTTCGHDELNRETVRSALWLGARLVVVEGIPALACGACGERYYAPETSEALQRLRDAGFPEDQAHCRVSVPVFRFEALKG